MNQQLILLTWSHQAFAALTFVGSRHFELECAQKAKDSAMATSATGDRSALRSFCTRDMRTLHCSARLGRFQVSGAEAVAQGGPASHFILQSFLARGHVGFCHPTKTKGLSHFPKSM